MRRWLAAIRFPLLVLLLFPYVLAVVWLRVAHLPLNALSFFGGPGPILAACSAWAGWRATRSHAFHSLGAVLAGAVLPLIGLFVIPPLLLLGIFPREAFSEFRQVIEDPGSSLVGFLFITLFAGAFGWLGGFFGLRPGARRVQPN